MDATDHTEALNTGPNAKADIAKPRALLSKDQAIAIFQLRPNTEQQQSRRASSPIARAFGVSEKPETVRDIWSASTGREDSWAAARAQGQRAATAARAH